MNNSQLLSDFLSGMSPASRVSVTAMRRLIENSNPKLSPNFDPAPPVFIPVALSLSDIRLFDANFAPTNGYAILFVSEGRGFLETAGNDGEGTTPSVVRHTLKNHSFFFFPLSKSWRLCMENTAWKCYLFFLGGDSASYYYRLFSDSAKEAFAISGSSMLPISLTHLYDSFSECKRDPLWVCEQLTSLLCLTVKEARCYAQSNLPSLVPSYLISIRNSFHKDYATPFSLTMLETKYQISRFRIAHEFTAAFGQSPIAYLNELRLQKACELLTNSDARIGEISAEVGFESTNHFINLFRRQHGLTPGAYRKRYQG